MKNKEKSFEDYLQDIHAKQYIGIDDDMPDDFNDWLCDLDIEGWINYGEIYARNKQIETIDKLGGM